MTDLNATIDQAQTPGTFNVLSFVEGTAYPTSEVVVYQDAQSATELLRLNNKRKELEANAVSADEKIDTTDIDAEIEALSEKVKNSAIIFELRGLPPGIVQELYNPNEEDEEKSLSAMDSLIAKTIVAARNASGARDAHLFTEEEVATLRRFLKEGEFGKLIKGVVDVNFNAVVFDQATDAGFLSRSTDLA